MKFWPLYMCLFPIYKFHTNFPLSPTNPPISLPFANPSSPIAFLPPTPLFFTSLIQPLAPFPPHKPNPLCH